MQELEMKFYSNRSPKKGYSWETPPEPIPEDQIAETVTTEVLVIGGGISGLAASARCADKGLKVIALDKNEKTLALAGQIAAVNSRVMAEKGITIDKKILAADWLKMSGSRVQEDLLWIFLNRSAEGFHWMLDLAGDCIDVGVYEAYQGPMFSEYPGTHHIFQKQGSTKYKAWGGGPLACEILEKALIEKGGTLLRLTPALYLEKNGEGRVTGCIAKCPDEKYRRYQGTKAVVLATGDCSEDREMLEAFCPIGTRPPNHFRRPGNTGDGQKMLYWVGAAIDNPEWAATLHALGGCAQTVLLGEVARDGVHVGLGGHRHVEAGVEDRDVGDALHLLLAGLDAGEVGRVVERAEVEALADRLLDGGVDERGFGEFQTAVEDAVANGVDFGEGLDRAVLGVCQGRADMLEGLSVVEGLDALSLLLAARRLVDEVRVFCADTFHYALAEHGFGLHAEEHVLE